MTSEYVHPDRDVPAGQDRPVRSASASSRRHRVTILGINYAPEPTGIAPYTTGVATALAERGHSVTVLTGYPHYPYWKHDDDRRFRSEEWRDGVLVRRFRHPLPRILPWLGRVFMELAFGVQLVTSRWGRPDVVICVTPPLLSTAMAAVRVRLTPGRPSLGILVQDVYSRGLAETGVANWWLAGLVKLVEKTTLRLADGVSVIHTGFARDLHDNLHVDMGKMREIRNWTHVSRPDSDASVKFRADHGWGPDELIVLHAGNMGYKQGLENVVAAAALASRDGHPIRFVLLGDGNQRAHLEALARGVPAIEFLPPVDDVDFPAALGAADVLLVNERPGVANMSVPSKLTSYFSTGKPVLAAADPDGFTAAELAAAGAGVCVPPDRPDLLVSEAGRLGADRALSASLGKAGLRYSADLLSDEDAFNRYEQWVNELAGSKRSRD